MPKRSRKLRNTKGQYSLTYNKKTSTWNVLTNAMNHGTYLEVTGQVFFVKSMIVNFDLGKCTKIVWHKHDRDGNMGQLAYSMVDAPHKHRQQRVWGPIKLPFGMLNLDVLGLGRAQAHAGFGRGHGDPRSYLSTAFFKCFLNWIFETFSIVV